MNSFMKCVNKTSRCAALFRGERLEEERISGYQDVYILVVCNHPGISQDQLARRICVNKSNVTRQLTLLEQNGFVTRKPCPRDRRIMEVFPTDRALEILPKVREVNREWSDYLMEEFTPAEREQLIGMMERVMNRAVERLIRDRKGEPDA